MVLRLITCRVVSHGCSKLRTGEVYGAFFAGLFLLATAAGVLWLRYSYQVQSAQQMSTIVSLNEERVKILTRLNQQTHLQASGAPGSLSKPLLPKG